jgi:hypothetical protein
VEKLSNRFILYVVGVIVIVGVIVGWRYYNSISTYKSTVVKDSNGAVIGIKFSKRIIE